jgi:hypothetical protein
MSTPAVVDTLSPKAEAFTGYCNKRGSAGTSWTYKWFNYNPTTGSIKFYVDKMGKKVRTVADVVLAALC